MTNSANSCTHDAALAMLQKNKALLVDIRDADAYKTAHILYAVSVPLAQLTSCLTPAAVASTPIIICQCDAGIRSQTACAQLAKTLGKTHTLLSLTGGINAWQAANLPVVRDKPTTAGLSLIRQVHLTVGSALLVIAIGDFSPILTGLIGSGLVIAGATGWCGMARFLSLMPWNRR